MAKKLTEPFMLAGDPTRYTAFWIDPITKNEISIQLDSQDENNLSMKVRTILPTKTGTFFHRDIKLTRKK